MPARGRAARRAVCQCLSISVSNPTSAPISAAPERNAANKSFQGSQSAKRRLQVLSVFM